MQKQSIFTTTAVLLLKVDAQLIPIRLRYIYGEKWFVDAPLLSCGCTITHLMMPFLFCLRLLFRSLMLNLTVVQNWRLKITLTRHAARRKFMTPGEPSAYIQHYMYRYSISIKTVWQDIYSWARYKPQIIIIIVVVINSRQSSRSCLVSPSKSRGVLSFWRKELHLGLRQESGRK